MKSYDKNYHIGSKGGIFLPVFGERKITLRFDCQALWLCDYKTTRLQIMQTTANYS